MGALNSIAVLGFLPMAWLIAARPSERQGADHDVAGQLLRAGAGHGPVDQRPVRRGPELPEDGHRYREDGQLDRGRGGQCQHGGDQGGDHGQDGDGDAQPHPGVTLAGQLEVGLRVGLQHGGHPDRVTFQVVRPPGQPGHGAGEAAGRTHSQLRAVLRHPDQVIQAHVPVMGGHPPDGGGGLAAGPQRRVDDRAAVLGAGRQVGQPVGPVRARLVHPDDFAFQYRAVVVRRGVRAGAGRRRGVRAGAGAGGAGGLQRHDLAACRRPGSGCSALP